jgi:hypothetical protein
VGNDFLKVLLIILSGILAWLFHKQSKELNELRDVVQIQNTAIQKQNFLIDYQKYYIQILKIKTIEVIIHCLTIHYDNFKPIKKR